MWFITLIVLALAAFLIVKAVKAQSDRKTASESDPSTLSGLQGQLKRDEVSQNATVQQSAANDSEQFNTPPAEEPQANLNVSASESAPSAEAQQDESREIREMIKILNLAEVDSARLGISRDQFNALRAEESASLDASARPTRAVQTDIADRLRRMLA